MRGINLNGIESPFYYTLPRVCVYVGVLDDLTGEVVGNKYLPIGHTRAVTISPEITTSEHRNLCDVNAPVDDQFDTQKRYNISFEAEELHHENIARFFLGDVREVENPLVAGVTDLVVSEAAQIGGSYFLETPWDDKLEMGGVPLLNVDPADLTLTYDADGGNITLIEGTHYAFDAQFGAIRLLPALADEVGYVADMELTATVAANAEAGANVEQVTAISAPTRNYRVMFKGKDGRTLETWLIVAEKTRLIPDGDFSLASLEELTVVSFTGALANNAAVRGRSQMLNVHKSGPTAEEDKKKK